MRVESLPLIGRNKNIIYLSPSGVPAPVAGPRNYIILFLYQKK